MDRNKHTRKPPVQKRTVVVWVTLLLSLSLVSGALMAINPIPHAPAGGMMIITSPEPGLEQTELLFTAAAAAPQGRWDSIVVHHSGDAGDSADDLNRRHMASGHGGLLFHFVIGNGDTAGDGELQYGFRWAQQLDSAERTGAISICLIGDFDRDVPTRPQMERLTWLVRELQDRFSIPAERVFLRRDLADTTDPGMLFPASRFRRQLLSPTALGG